MAESGFEDYSDDVAKISSPAVGDETWEHDLVNPSGLPRIIDKHNSVFRKDTPAYNSIPLLKIVCRLSPGTVDSLCRNRIGRGRLPRDFCACR